MLVINVSILIKIWERILKKSAKYGAKATSSNIWSVPAFGVILRRENLSNRKFDRFLII